MATDKKEIWIGWTRDAMARYERPDSIEDTDDLVNDMTDVSIGYADLMLEEFENRFSGGEAGRPARKRREPRKD